MNCEQRSDLISPNPSEQICSLPWEGMVAAESPKEATTGIQVQEGGSDQGCDRGAGPRC